MKGVSLSKKTEQERLRLLYAPMLANQIIGSLVVTLILVMLFAQQVSLWRMIPWVCISLGAIAYHVWLLLTFREERSKSSFSTTQWEQKFLLGVGGSALVWGSACGLLYEGATSHQIYLALIVTGVSVVAIKLFSPSLKAMVIYAVLAIVPLIIYFLVTGLWLGLPLLAYLFFQIGISYTNGIKFQHDYYTSQSMEYATRRRELTLRKRDERHRTWFKQAADATLLLTEDKILQANKAAVKLLGYKSATQLLKTHPKNLLVPIGQKGQLTKEQFKTARQTLEQQGTCQLTGEYVRLDGKKRPAEVTLTAIPFKQSSAYFCVARDISAQRALIKKLQQEKAQIKTDNQAISAYYQHISKAIFTPLNGVLGHSNLLLQQNNLSQDQQMRTRVIKRSAESLLGLFNDVLDVTKLDAGTLELVERDFDLRALLDSFVETAKERSEAKGLELKHHIDPNMQPYYKGDANRITQILEQLFTNALKHTRKGEIKLLAKMLKTNQAGAMLRFDVIDSGPGVNQAQQAYLFDRFRQADGTANGQIGGTGLGLSLSQGLAELMGGEVGYTQHKGHGAHFWFKIRLYKAAKVKAKPKTQKTKQKGINTFDAKVLVVDDNRTSLLVAKGSLEVFGLEIDLVNSGAEAIYMLRKHDYDLVFMDCLMPKMDGYQTTRKIRSLSSKVKNHNIPIIAMTSNNQEGDREICLEAGMNDYLTKPIDIRVIQQMLQFWLTNQ